MKKTIIQIQLEINDMKGKQPNRKELWDAFNNFLNSNFPIDFVEGEVEILAIK